MNIEFSGKCIVITGAAGGIGRASAELFGELGAQVVATDFNEAGLKETVSAINEVGGTASGKVADITDPAQVDAIIDFAYEEFGKIDILFNNAGGSFPTPMGDIDRAEYERLRALNFDAVYHACIKALPKMVEAGGGTIVSTTSSAGTLAVTGLGVYGAAKAGVNSLTRSIALEYGRHGIRANAIGPSSASDGMIQFLETLPGGIAGFSDKLPMGRLGKPEEIAHVAAFLASDYSSFINGVVIPVDGGIEATLASPLT